MTQMTKQIATQSEQVAKALTDLFHEQQKGISEHMNQQLEYTRTQSNIASKRHVTSLNCTF